MKKKINQIEVLNEMRQREQKELEIWRELILPKAQELVSRGYKWETAKKMARNAIMLNINV